MLPFLAARAIEENQWACFSRVCGDGFHEEDDLAWYQSGVLDPGLNGVLKATLRPDVVDERIEEALEPFRRRKLPMCWWVGPSSGPAGLGERLESHGLKLEARPPGMAVELALLREAEPPKGLRIERVRDRKAMAEWTRVVISAFGIPVESSGLLLDLVDRVGYAPDSDLSSYVGILGDEVVSSSSLFLEGEVAGVYNVATLPDARGRGIGAAMTLAPLKEARVRGGQDGDPSVVGHGLRGVSAPRIRAVLHLRHVREDLLGMTWRPLQGIAQRVRPRSRHRRGRLTDGLGTSLRVPLGASQRFLPIMDLTDSLLLIQGSIRCYMASGGLPRSCSPTSSATPQ